MEQGAAGPERLEDLLRNQNLNYRVKAPVIGQPCNTAAALSTSSLATANTRWIFPTLVLWYPQTYLFPALSDPLAQAYILQSGACRRPIRWDGRKTQHTHDLLGTWLWIFIKTRKRSQALPKSVLDSGLYQGNTVYFVGCILGLIVPSGFFKKSNNTGCR